MKTTTDSKQDVDRFAVIRHYEPTRIERELLAQVFEIVSHRSKHDDGRVDQESSATLLCSAKVADDVRHPRGLAPADAARGESLEPAA